MKTVHPPSRTRLAVRLANVSPSRLSRRGARRDGQTNDANRSDTGAPVGPAVVAEVEEPRARVECFGLNSGRVRSREMSVRGAAFVLLRAASFDRRSKGSGDLGG